MPQMGDLLQGFLYRKQEYEQKEVAEEQEKRQKLEEQLSELKFTKLQRDMARSAEEWERQQAQYKAFGELSLPEQKEVRFGIEPEEEPEPPYPWMGTPYEEEGRRKEFYISPEKETGQSKFEKAFGDVRKYLELSQPGVRGALGPETPPETLNQQALDKAIRAAYPKMFGEEEEATMPSASAFGQAGEVLGERGRLDEGIRAEDIQDSLILDKVLPFLEMGGEHPEEDAYIQQVKSYLSDYDIDWDVIAKKHPNWNIEYMKTKLGQ